VKSRNYYSFISGWKRWSHYFTGQYIPTNLKFNIMVLGYGQLV
jgi:hypothetical protein